jgi:predicted transcriptional regulator
LQDIDEYQFMQRKLEIAELLAQGEADIQAGRLIPALEVRKRAHAFLQELESNR